MDKSWQGWVAENLARGCDPAEIAGILQQHQFSLTEIRSAMGDKFPETYAMAEMFAPAESGVDYAALANIRITREKQPGLARVDTPKLQLYAWDGFMTAAECDALVKLIEPTLRPSTVSYGPGDYRTSRTSDLGLLKDPLVKAVDEKIASALGIRLPYSETIQAQKYQVGEEFKPHTDYFEPGTDEYAQFAATMGNRTWTFMVYLNDTPKGGGTQFPEIGTTFYPQKGKAVVWNNLREGGAPNPDALHWGMPVEEGEKVIITKWFREKGSGPMFWEG